MQNYHRFTISLPKEEFIAIENYRKQNGLDRSTVVDMTVKLWLENIRKRVLIKRYEEGYKKKLEPLHEISALEKESANAFEEEGLK